MAVEHLTKRCTRCEAIKPLTEFNVRRDRRGGRVSACKACSHASCLAYRAANREKMRAYAAAYRAANPDERRASEASSRAANRDKIKVQRAAYRAANREKVRAGEVAYRVANREKLAAQTAARRAGVSAALALIPLVEDLKARVAALEALIASTPKATVATIAPERPRRKRAVHEHHTPEPVLPSATPPVIRTIRDIIAHDGATATEAKRIQEREILARAEWRPTGNA
ncbi:MAG: hypothetical protein ABSC06_35040 [Rhodopila sp.]